MPYVNGKSFPYTAKGKAAAKKAEDEASGNAQKRRSNPFIDINKPKANVEKYGKATDPRNVKRAALSAMRKKKIG